MAVLRRDQDGIRTRCRRIGVPQVERGEVVGAEDRVDHRDLQAVALSGPLAAEERGQNSGEQLQARGRVRR
jgi:hypothetical protein